MKDNKEQVRISFAVRSSPSGRSARVGGVRRFALAVALCLLASIGAGGCGRQDRLEPTALEYPDETPLVDWGVLEDPQAILYGTWVPKAVSAWSTDDVLLGLWPGVIVRITGDTYRRLDLPGHQRIRGLVCNDDGSAWCLDYLGGVWLLENDGWTRRAELAGDDFRGLARDANGRLWAFGDEGVLWCGTTEGWQRKALPDSLDLHDLWADPSGDVYLVSSSLALVHVTDTGWEITTLEYPAPDDHAKRIEGDGNGQLVVGAVDRAYVWLYDGAEWVKWPGGSSSADLITDLFWSGADLCGVLSNQTRIGRWNGDGWDDGAHLSETQRGDAGLSCPVGTDRILAFESGSVTALGEMTATLFSPGLGRLIGAVQLDGVLYAGYARGNLLVQDGEVWRSGPQILGEGESLISVWPDSRGEALLAVGTEGIREWRDGVVREIYEFEHSSWSEVLGQDDGSLLFYDRLDSDYRFYTIRDGVLTATGLRCSSSDMRDACLGSEGRILALESWRLREVTGTGSRTLLTLGGWWARGILLDPDRGAVLYGDDKVLLEDGDAFVDVSPWDSGGGAPWRRVRLVDLVHDGRNDWLGVSDVTARLYRYDGTAWSKLNLLLPESGRVEFIGAQIRPAGDGTFLLFNSIMLQRFIPPGAGL